MCEVCGYARCKCVGTSSEGVYTCKICKEPIYDGDEYYRIDDEFYHSDCFEDNSLKILLEKVDVVQGFAESEENSW